jgi:hypothetical protein
MPPADTAEDAPDLAAGVGIQARDPGAAVPEEHLLGRPADPRDPSGSSPADSAIEMKVPRMLY